MSDEVISKEMSEVELINHINNMEASIKNYNTYNEEENKRKLEQKRKELEDILSSRKNSISTQEDNELGIISEKIFEEKNNFIREKNRLDLLMLDIDKLLLKSAREKVDRKKLPAPTTKYSYGEIKIVADKISNKGPIAKIMKLFRINGYSSDVNLTIELLNRISSTKAYMDEEIRKIDEKYRNEIEALKGKYSELSDSQTVTQEEEDGNESELSELEKEFRLERENFIASLRIKENFDNLKNIFDELYFKDELYENTDNLSNNTEKILFGSVSMEIEKDNLIEEMKKQDILSLYSFIEENENTYKISIPVIKDINSIKVLFDMSDRKECLGEKDLAVFLREICYRYIRSASFNEINVTFMDPEDRGSNAGFLQKLAMDNECRVVNPVCTTEASITSKIVALEKDIAEIIRKMMGYKDVKSYNENESEKIPYQLVVINDFPAGFTTDTLNRLKIIIKNAQKCGISLVISRDMRTYAENIEKFGDAGNEINELIESEFERFYKDGENCYFGAENGSKIDLAISNALELPENAEKDFVERVLEDSKKS